MFAFPQKNLQRFQSEQHAGMHSTDQRWLSLCYVPSDVRMGRDVVFERNYIKENSFT
jgi:hypothetical protein